jgi:hypothetical protein
MIILSETTTPRSSFTPAIKGVCFLAFLGLVGVTFLNTDVANTNWKGETANAGPPLPKDTSSDHESVLTVRTQTVELVLSRTDVLYVHSPWPSLLSLSLLIVFVLPAKHRGRPHSARHACVRNHLRYASCRGTYVGGFLRQSD